MKSIQEYKTEIASNEARIMKLNIRYKELLASIPNDNSSEALSKRNRLNKLYTNLKRLNNILNTLKSHAVQVYGMRFWNE